MKAVKKLFLLCLAVSTCTSKVQHSQSTNFIRKTSTIGGKLHDCLCSTDLNKFKDLSRLYSPEESYEKFVYMNQKPVESHAVVQDSAKWQSVNDMPLEFNDKSANRHTTIKHHTTIQPASHHATIFRAEDNPTVIETYKYNDTNDWDLYDDQYNEYYAGRYAVPGYAFSKGDEHKTINKHDTEDERAFLLFDDWFQNEINKKYKGKVVNIADSDRRAMSKAFYEILLRKGGAQDLSNVQIERLLMDNVKTDENRKNLGVSLWNQFLDGTLFSWKYPLTNVGYMSIGHLNNNKIRDDLKRKCMNDECAPSIKRIEYNTAHSNRYIGKPKIYKEYIQTFDENKDSIEHDSERKIIHTPDNWSQLLQNYKQQPDKRVFKYTEESSDRYVWPQIMKKDFPPKMDQEFGMSGQIKYSDIVAHMPWHLPRLQSITGQKLQRNVDHTNAGPIISEDEHNSVSMNPAHIQEQNPDSDSNDKDATGDEVADDEGPGTRIIGGSAATGSGTPVDIVGRFKEIWR